YRNETLRFLPKNSWQDSIPHIVLAKYPLTRTSQTQRTHHKLVPSSGCVTSQQRSGYANPPEVSCRFFLVKQAKVNRDNPTVCTSMVVSASEKPTFYHLCGTQHPGRKPLGRSWNTQTLWGL